jgi:hypothetical protein
MSELIKMIEHGRPASIDEPARDLTPGGNELAADLLHCRKFGDAARPGAWGEKKSLA